MSSIQERLLRIYDKKPETQEPQSWIPKREYRKGDLLGQLASSAQKSERPSQVRSEEIIEREAILFQTKAEIFQHVIEHFRKEYGEEGLEWRLGNFQASWDRMIERYEEDLIEALGELVEILDDEPFVNFAGYIDKEVLKNQVRIVKSRRRGQAQ